MIYQANPIQVYAFEINEIGDLKEDGSRLLKINEHKNEIATKEMLSRIDLKKGDYWVVQYDGYTYLNPKNVFERKYSLLS